MNGGCSHGPVRLRSLMVSGLVLLAGGVGTAWGDDSGFLGRLFRFGGGSAGSNGTSAAGNQPTTLPYGRYAGSPSGFVPPPASAPALTDPLPTFGGLPVETLPTSNPAGPAQHLTPKPRVSAAVTTADPILTRFALGRSNDGSQFGMFLQIFSDGTVVDSEGAHRVRPADLKPVLDSVQSGELYRLRGHCGAPSTDFLEYVHVIVYDRRFGRLMAYSFSYSGNPQGCDHAIRHLHTALENLQAKLSRQPVVETPGFGGSPSPLGASSFLQPREHAVSPLTPLRPVPPSASLQPGGPLPGLTPPVPTNRVIPLSPAGPTH